MAVDAAEGKGPQGLFHEVTFHIVVSDKLSQRTAYKVASVLEKEGATQASGVSSQYPAIGFDLEQVTHIIAEDIDFPGYVEAETAMIPIVTPAWVEASLQKKRLAHVRPYTPDPRLFFSGVIVTCVDLPEGDREAIFGGVLALGGQYSLGVTKLVTHVVALNMDNEKLQQGLEKGFKFKVVLPHWFDDCLRLNRRINEKPYQFPDPEIQRVPQSDPVTIPPSDRLKLTHNISLDKEPPLIREDFRVFEGKSIFLSKDLGIRQDLRKTLQGIIESGRGSVTTVLDDADVYVGQYREGSNYRKASRKGIVVGNLLWLYWMCSHNEWASPLKRLLHYPVVRGGLKGMENAVISVSNYGGDARMFLENLVIASGARFTKSMKTENTHLITARSHSEKCIAAKEWNIHMVNHLWLEESYAKWEVQSLSNPKYSHFPVRTNLTEVVGMTPIDAKALRQFYDEESDEEMEPAEKSDEEMTDADNNDAAEQLKTMVATPKTPATSNARSGQVPTTADSLRRKSTLVTPASRRTTGSMFDETPNSIMSSGRRAKEAAASKLHESINDMNLYEKEKKRKGGVLGIGRKRRSSITDLEQSFSERATSEEGHPKSKKVKRPKVVVKLLVTTYDEWMDPDREESDKRALLELGIEVTQEPKECTHLAAPKLVRTKKFVSALAFAPEIVKADWFEACLKEKKIVDTEPYRLKDREAEERLGVNLKTTLERAKKVKGKLLKDLTIYIAPNVSAGFETCKAIVEANGGTCVSFRMGKRISNANTPHVGPKLVLISSDKAGDVKMWKQFDEMAKAMKFKSYIYEMDWLLGVTMNQQLEWTSKHILPDWQKQQ